MPLISDYSESLAKLIPTVGTPAFSQRMIDLLSRLVSINDATIIVYPPKRLPVIDYYQPLADGSSELNKFINGAFLLDPYYIAATDREEFGFFHLKDISPDGFRESEYYRTFYRKSGYQDECGYIIPTAKGGFAQISLARTHSPAKFADSQLTLLKQISVVVEELGRQHWSSNEADNDGENNLRVPLHTALEEFGSSLLTARQMQVINFLLHGYSTRMVSEKLEISIETVKLHRKHAYAKLSVSSQGELFYLFLDSLMSAKNYSNGDTLTAYLQLST